ARSRARRGALQLGAGVRAAAGALRAPLGLSRLVLGAHPLADPRGVVPALGERARAARELGILAAPLGEESAEHLLKVVARGADDRQLGQQLRRRMPPGRLVVDEAD